MISFLKIRDVKNPTRRFGDAGIDFFVPELNDEFLRDLKAKNPDRQIDENGITLKPGEDILIPSGIKCKFDAKIALEAANKSGICTREKLIVGAQVIDSTYQAECHIHLFNIGTKNTTIKYGQKIVQFIPRFIDTEEIFVTDVEDGFYTFVTERGEGGFGSTGV